jgi:hypothetical protein
MTVEFLKLSNLVRIATKKLCGMHRKGDHSAVTMEWPIFQSVDRHQSQGRQYFITAE